MIQASIHLTQERQGFVFGLTAENVRRLRTGEPILVNLERLGFSGGLIFLTGADLDTVCDHIWQKYRIRVRPPQGKSPLLLVGMAEPDAVAPDWIIVGGSHATWESLLTGDCVQCQLPIWGRHLLLFGGMTDREAAQRIERALLVSIPGEALAQHMAESAEIALARALLS